MYGAVRGELDKLWATTAAGRARSALADFAALVFPTECVGCGLPDASLCGGCSTAFRSATVRPFRAEGAAEALPDRYPLRLEPLSADRLSADLLPSDPLSASQPAEDGSEPLPVVSAGIYSGVVAQVVLAFKNHGHTDLAPQLLAALAGALHHAARTLTGGDPPVWGLPLPGTAHLPVGGLPAAETGGLPAAGTAGLPAAGTAHLLLVPVPGKGSSFRWRGYDPVGLLLRRLARRKLLPEATAVGEFLAYTHQAALLHSLAAVQKSSGQKGLGGRKRRTSVRGSMRVRRSAQRSLAGHTCIIIDDVLTTGATIAEAARVLHLGGATVAGAVVVAATSGPRREDRPSQLPPTAN